MESISSQPMQRNITSFLETYTYNISFITTINNSHFLYITNISRWKTNEV